MDGRVHSGLHLQPVIETDPHSKPRSPLVVLLSHVCIQQNFFGPFQQYKVLLCSFFPVEVGDLVWVVLSSQKFELCRYLLSTRCLVTTKERVEVFCADIIIIIIAFQYRNNSYKDNDL